ncbi:MAG: dependent oxidoreductase, partial [Verrucomicrobia bacterium]|nr:dependent oxidoreductase [Verrucomicrobiota bacterium]
MKHPYHLLSALLTAALLAVCPSRADEPAHAVDVCVYGATPAGILAAVAAKQEGCTVLLIEPSRWVGGILGAGIKPMQDCAEPKAVGGLTATRVFSIGNRPDAIRAGFTTWLQQEQIPVIFEHRVQRVEKSGAAIVKLVLELAPPDNHAVPAATATKKEARTITAKVFIDATYEGDVMAGAGVRYAVGREAAETYQEKLAGVGPTTNWTPIDPYVIAGDPKSGLLPLVDADHGLPKGAADDYSQAYNYRYYVTNDPAKRIAFGRPAGYDPKDFELVARYVEHLVRTSAGDDKTLMKRLREIFPGWMNGGEYNYKRESLVTIAPLGVSRFYQDGTREVRSRIWRQHQDYLAGLHYFLSTDARVPESFREETAALGLDKTMHPDTDGWPNQLYVRITRRMKGPYVLTLADVWNQTKVEDGVGLALYGVDIYPVRRYAVASPTTG